MRKTKLKLLNFSLLLLLIYSCSNQEDYISNHHHSEKIKNEISFQQFLNETNVNDFSVRLKLNPASNALQRTASLNNFVIDTVAILKHIAQDNKATYSFKVEPLNTLEYSEAKSYNVVYHKISNSWEKTLISFDEIENPINNTKSFNNFDNLFSESIAMRGACFTYVEVDNCNNRCIGTCDRCTECLQISYVAVECGVAGGGDDPYNPDLDQNPNYSGGTTGGDGSIILEFEPNPKGGGGSLIVEQNPCNQLKSLFNKPKPDIKKTITEDLQPDILINARGEKAAYLQKLPNGAMGTTVSASTSTNNVGIRTGGNHYAAIHTHPNNCHPMFTWSDVLVLKTLYDNLEPHNIGMASYTLVCQDESGVFQTYAIVFNTEGLNTLDLVFNSPFWAGKTPAEIALEMDDIMGEGWEKEAKNGTHDYAKVFLNQFSGSNVSLYKANSDLDSWSRLQINTATNNSMEIPCE